MGDKVEVIFSAKSPQYGAEVDDRKMVPVEDVPRLVSDGVAAPPTKAAAKQAGVDPEAAASVKK